MEDKTDQDRFAEFSEQESKLLQQDLQRWQQRKLEDIPGSKACFVCSLLIEIIQRKDDEAVLTAAGSIRSVWWPQTTARQGQLLPVCSCTDLGIS